MFWTIFDPTWASESTLGAFRGPPEALFGRLGPPMGSLGASLWHICGPHGASRSPLGRLGVPRVPLLEVLGGFWVVFGALGCLLWTSRLDFGAFRVFFFARPKVFVIHF